MLRADMVALDTRFDETQEIEANEARLAAADAKHVAKGKKRAASTLGGTKQKSPAFRQPCGPRAWLDDQAVQSAINEGSSDRVAGSVSVACLKSSMGEANLISGLFGAMGAAEQHPASTLRGKEVAMGSALMGAGHCEVGVTGPNASSGSPDATEGLDARSITRAVHTAQVLHSDSDTVLRNAGLGDDSLQRDESHTLVETEFITSRTGNTDANAVFKNGDPVGGMCFAIGHPGGPEHALAMHQASCAISHLTSKVDLLLDLVAEPIQRQSDAKRTAESGSVHGAGSRVDDDSLPSGGQGSGKDRSPCPRRICLKLAHVHLDRDANACIEHLETRNADGSLPFVVASAVFPSVGG